MSHLNAKMHKIIIAYCSRKFIDSIINIGKKIMFLPMYDKRNEIARYEHHI